MVLELCVPKYAAVCTSNVAIYYYSARKLMLILTSHRREKAKLTSVAGYIPKWFTCLQTITHPTIYVGLKSRRVTSLITTSNTVVPISQTTNF